METTTIYTCENCEWTGDADSLDEPDDLMERLGPNPDVLLPDGECPECSCLVYDPKDEAEFDERARKLKVFPELLEALKRLISVTDHDSGYHAAAVISQAFRLAKDAIAKAEKGTP